MSMAPDDFAPGMFVTVLETVVERPHPFPGASGSAVFDSKDYSGAGVVLEVVEVSFPFVLVRNHTQEMLRSPRMFPIDLRRTRLIRLNKEYVRAALAGQPGQKPLGAPGVQQGGQSLPALPFVWGAGTFPEKRDDA